MIQRLQTGLLLFILASVFTFGFIALLQFTPMPWFFLVLILMHVGIFMFIASKRYLRNTGFNVRSYYTRQYLLLAPYGLIMLYTFAGRWGLFPLNDGIKTILILAYTVLCVLLTISTYLHLKADLNRQLNAKTLNL